MSDQESDAARIQRQANERSHYESNQRNHQSSGCFPAGTKIQTPFGTKSIETLSEGDRVIGVSLRNESKRPCKVLKIKSHRPTRIWEITLSNKETIRTTAAHSFHSGGKWKLAKALKKGDSILYWSEQGDFKQLQISESGLVEANLPVFNLIVENEFTFVADGAIAHSFSHFRVLRSLFVKVVNFLPSVTSSINIRKGHLRRN